FHDQSDGVYHRFFEECIAQLTAADLMDTQFVQLPESSSYREALSALIKSPQRCLVIVDPQQQPIGIFSAQELLQAQTRHVSVNDQATISDYMSENFYTVGVHARLNEIFNASRQGRVEHVLVVDDDLCLGLLHSSR